MCNMAGYIGKKNAAEVLIDMMRREEGLAGGYFTGIATLDGGRIASAKLIGDTERLLRLTDAASLRGNVGLMHSRSKGYGDGEWAHPFLGVRDGNTEMAYIANGGMGFFAPRADERTAIADGLLRDGYELRSRKDEKKNVHIKLSDGAAVHVSDVMCQLIYRNIRSGLEPRAAMEKAYTDMPGEIAGLLLAPSVPDGIVWSRISMPIFVAFASHGAYIATSSLAFPEDAGEPILLPANSSGVIYADNYFVKPYEKAPARLAETDAAVRCAAYEKICEVLSEGDKIFADLYRAIDGLFEKADICQREPLAYEVIYSLMREGRLEKYDARVDGVLSEIDAPQTRLSLKQ